MGHGVHDKVRRRLDFIVELHLQSLVLVSLLLLQSQLSLRSVTSDSATDSEDSKEYNDGSYDRNAYHCHVVHPVVSLCGVILVL